jgi:hypothetical protein
MRAASILRLFTAVSLFAAPTALEAQRSITTMPARDGFSFGLGLGAGSNGYACTGCGTDRRNGGSGYLTIGYAMSPSLLVSGEVNGWSRQQDGTSYSTAFVGPTAQWYPAVDAGFFLKAGAGLGSVRLKDNTALSQDEMLSRGFGYQVGTGYDLQITHSFSLTPYVGYMGMAGSNASVNGQSMNEKLDGNFVHYGIGLTWH